MHRYTYIAALTAGFACFAAGAVAQGQPSQGNVAQGRLDVYSCAGCHGVAGYNALYPMFHEPLIAGQNEQYLIDALGDYRNGARKYPTMNAQASSLTTQQVHDIAAYLSSLAPDTPHQYDRHEGNIDAGRAKATTCAACHGKDGMGVAPNFPALAGQFRDYLVNALHEYKSGKRKNTIMNGQASALSDQDIDDVAAYFSSLPSKLASLDGKIQGSGQEVFHNP